MADNTILPGTGDIVADEDIGGVKYQRVKLIDGALGSKTPVSLTETGEIPVHDEALVEELGASTQPYASSEQERSLYDVLDPTHPDFVPLVVAPAGIETPGQRAALASFPVVLPPEQMQDYSAIASWNQVPNGVNVMYSQASNVNTWFDVSQYRSISLHIVQGNAGGQVYVEGSNDGVSVATVPLYDGAALATAPTNNLVLSALTSRFFEGPLRYKYLRLRGTAQAVFMTLAYRLSMAPYIPLYVTTVQPTAGNLNVTATGTGTYAVNVSQFAGVAAASAGVTGTIVAGGGVAPGAAVGAYNPLTMAGADITGKVRRILTDTASRVQVVPPDNVGTTTVDQAVFPVKFTQQDNEGATIHDLLGMILAEMKAMNYYLAELPQKLRDGGTFIDEPVQLTGDPTLLNS